MQCIVTFLLINWLSGCQHAPLETVYVKRPATSLYLCAVTLTVLVFDGNIFSLVNRHAMAGYRLSL